MFHDAIFAKERAQRATSPAACFSLRDAADAEQLYLCTLNAPRAAASATTGPRYPEITAHLERTLVDRYFCNFSVFQSLPDNWAIDQLFPIMPIHRLRRAARRAAAPSRTSPATPTA